MSDSNMALPPMEDRATAASQSDPQAVPSIAGIPSADDHAIAERANVAWGEAINGPHVAVIAAQMGRHAGYLEGLAAAAEIAKAHQPARIAKGVPLSRYHAEDRHIIRTEENGEGIAADCIAFAINQARERAA